MTHSFANFPPICPHSGTFLVTVTKTDGHFTAQGLPTVNRNPFYWNSMNSLFARCVDFLLPVLTCALAAGLTEATTFTVSSSTDSGASLRAAIIAANADSSASAAAPHSIVFAIPGAGVHTITPTAQFPFITRPVVIDGFSQPGSSANTLAVGNDSVHLVELDGSNANITNACFYFRPGSAGSVLRGMVVNRCTLIAVIADTGNIKLEGNFLGTNAAGNASLGRGIVSLGTSFTPEPGAVIIGGPLPSQRNVIAGDATSIIVNNLSGVVISGNYIGTNAAGTAALGGQGIVMGTQGGPAIGPFTIGGITATPGTGAGNVISGGEGNGITVTAQGGTTIGAGSIQGNLIGLSASGNTAIGNGTGIELNDQAFANGAAPKISPIMIGGTAVGARNVISGNRGIGIVSVADGVSLQSNFIGTDINGNAALPNAGGIRVSGGAVFAGTSTIGGVGVGNVISGNSGSDAIVVTTTTAVIKGNLIGTRADGVAPLPNLGSIGIVINSGVGTIGGTAAGEGNTITGGSSDAIRVVIGTSSIRNAASASILGNSIYLNGPSVGPGGLGINLFAPDLVTLNDVGDADTGPSGLQNYPVVTVATAAGIVQGTFNSKAGATYRLEFFANPACDGSGYGEGKTFIGFQSVTTDGSGNASFNAAFAALPAGQSVVTATATDAAGNTSEFSQCVTASAPVMLTVVKNGSGSGTVTSSPAGINCGATCSASFGAGSAVTLTASPTSAASTFTGWLGSGCIGVLTCPLTLSTAANVSATFALTGNGPFNLDVDANSPVAYATVGNDGLLILRYMAGMSGATLIGGGVVSGDASRNTAAAIMAYLDDLKPKLDIDGNGQVDALTDGLLISRYLLDIRGPALIAGAIGVGATRTTFTQIENYLVGLLPP